MNRRYILPAILSSLLLALFVYAYQNITWVEEVIDAGPTAEARRNPLLAAETFLTEQAVPVQRQLGYALLDKPLQVGVSETNALLDKADQEPPRIGLDDSLVLVDGYSSLSPLRAGHLLDWVNAGGHLVMSASNPFVRKLETRQDTVLKALGVEVYDPESETSTTSDDSDEEDSLEDADSMEESFIERLKRLSEILQNESCGSIERHVTFTLREGQPIALHLPTDHYLDFDDENARYTFWASDHQGVAILQVSHGEGLVTVLGSLQLWKNQSIGCEDNVYFMQWLLADSPAVWFLVNQERENLWTLLWQNFRFALLLSGLLLVLWLWSKALRFGPVQEEESPDRRRLLEHVHASAVFLWRRPATRIHLIKAAQESVRRLMVKRVGHFRSLSERDQWAAIAEHSHATMNQVEACMQDRQASSTPIHAHEFIQTMRQLQNLKERL